MTEPGVFGSPFATQLCLQALSEYQAIFGIKLASATLRIEVNDKTAYEKLFSVSNYNAKLNVDLSDFVNE